MVRALPPLNWVRAFEAAARHRSFRLAADELGVSAGAVSQKVKALELHLGVALFARRPRGVLLTDAGRRYRDDLIPALDAIAAATGRIAKQPGGNRLRIVALPAIAEKWLTPRLPLFRDFKLELNIEVSVAPDVSELDQASFDVAVHYDIGGRADLVSVPLFRDEMFPVCSPALAEEIGFATPADLIGARLLYDTQWAEDWALWFRAAGVPTDNVERETGFTLYSMAVEAAVEGLGIAIGHQALVARELESERLIAPFDLRIPAPHGYAVIAPVWSSKRQDVGDFINWLRAAV